MAKRQDSLGAYRDRRDFARTQEPSAGRRRRGGRPGRTLEEVAAEADFARSP